MFGEVTAVMVESESTTVGIITDRGTAVGRSITVDIHVVYFMVASTRNRGTVCCRRQIPIDLIKTYQLYRFGFMCESPESRHRRVEHLEEAATPILSRSVGSVPRDTNRVHAGEASSRGERLAFTSRHKSAFIIPSEWDFEKIPAPHFGVGGTEAGTYCPIPIPMFPWRLNRYNKPSTVSQMLLTKVVVGGQIYGVPILFGSVATHGSTTRAMAEAWLTQMVHWLPDMEECRSGRQVLFQTLAYFYYTNTCNTELTHSNVGPPHLTPPHLWQKASYTFHRLILDSFRSTIPPHPNQSHAKPTQCNTCATSKSLLPTHFVFPASTNPHPHIEDSCQTIRCQQLPQPYNRLLESQTAECGVGSAPRRRVAITGAASLIRM
uniref:Integrase_SAM-like_N domain-containing protein n=1 Tax=Echinococcus granulosus TaxID=6210 RepID=A0A068WVU3_ECHGR|nr:hypothetical protein EgrG_002047100 [Echinococcus granulosus]